MTLSTRGEIEAGRRIDRIIDEVSADINPTAMVEEFVMEVEGTEDDPAVLDCAMQARQVADEVEGAAEPVAHLYAEDDIDAIAAAESMGERAELDAKEMLADIPTVVCE